MSLPHIYYDEDLLGHDPGPEHPEAPWRLRSILDYLRRENIPCVHNSVLRPAAVSELERVHSPEYIRSILSSRRQARALDHETILSSGSVDAALLAAGGAIMLVEDIMAKRVKRGFALVRPPGHHATMAEGMGYCIFNNIAVAAAAALHIGCEKVMIIDWDAHHGNGTEDIFADRADVLFVSLHQESLFPVGSGGINDRGKGPGRNFTINIPMIAGAGWRAYDAAIETVIRPAAREFRPDLVLVSCGFDAHVNDPLSELRLETTDFGRLTSAAVSIANEWSDGRIGLVLEGGYDVGSLGPSVAACLAALAQEP